MEDHHSLSAGPAREERVRALGVDPLVLSPDEQAELLEIHSVCPDEVLERVDERMI